MIQNSNNYIIGFDPKYSVPYAPTGYSNKSNDVKALIGADSELEKMSLDDIYLEMSMRQDIYRQNATGLQELDCKIGSRIIDFRYNPYARERITLELEQIKIQEKIFDERSSYFKDTMRLRELALKKKEIIRDDQSGMIEEMME